MSVISKIAFSLLVTGFNQTFGSYCEKVILSLGSLGTHGAGETGHHTTYAASLARVIWLIKC